MAQFSNEYIQVWIDELNKAIKELDNTIEELELMKDSTYMHFAHEPSGDTNIRRTTTFMLYKYSKTKEYLTRLSNKEWIPPFLEGDYIRGYIPKDNLLEWRKICRVYIRAQIIESEFNMMQDIRNNDIDSKNPRRYIHAADGTCLLG